MCSPAQCANCGRTTWRGCGQHVDAVMRSVPPAERCRCENPKPAGLFSGLFRRH